MEEGRWAEANTFKEQLENSQRNLRKLLVKKHQDTKIPDGPTDRRGITIGEEWWIPRWFVREIDQDTQEEHWRFTDDYWKIRNEVVSDPENAKWPDWVRDIFTA